jgi:transcriptional regulator with XRE-family HTH domain
MNSSSEKLAFSERLRQLLATRHWPVNSPTWLAREFNLRFEGPSVSVQSASNWLSGNAIPSQDKLQILAAWLEVSSEWLRFGNEAPADKVANHHRLYEGVRYNLDDLPDKLAKLSPRQKQAVYDVVEAMLESHKS